VVYDELKNSEQAGSVANRQWISQLLINIIIIFWLTCSEHAEIAIARKYLEFVALVLKVNDRSPFRGQDFQVQTIDEARYLFRQAHPLNREALKARVVLEVLRARERIRGAHHWDELLKQRL
jgi:hypothetical protein